MRRIVVAGWYGHGNVGDEAILEAMLHGLRGAMGGGVECVVLSGRPRVAAALHGVAAVALHGLRSIIPRLRAIRHADLFILGGGGFLADWQPEAPRTWLAAPRLACALGTTVMAYGIGAGPFLTAAGRQRVRRAIARFGAVTVRDATSAAWLAKAGVDGAVEVTADPAVGLVPVAGAQLAAVLSELGMVRGAPRIVWTLAPLYDREDLWPGMRERRERYVAACRAMLRWAFEETDAELVLWPFHRERDESFQRTLLDGPRNGGRVRVVTRAMAPSQVAGVLGCSDLVVGTRLHGAILAAVAGTPPVAIAYHHKVRDFMAQLGLPDLTLHAGDGTVYDAADVDPEHAVDVLRRAWKDRADLAVHVRRRMVALRHRERRNAAAAAGLLGVGG